MHKWKVSLKESSAEF